MSRITYIKPVTDNNSDNGSLEVHPDLINSDIDILAEEEKNTVADDDYDENNVFGY